MKTHSYKGWTLYLSDGAVRHYDRFCDLIARIKDEWPAVDAVYRGTTDTSYIQIWDARSGQLDPFSLTRNEERSLREALHMATTPRGVYR